MWPFKRAVPTYPEDDSTSWSSIFLRTMVVMDEMEARLDKFGNGEDEVRREINATKRANTERVEKSEVFLRVLDQIKVQA